MMALSVRAKADTPIPLDVEFRVEPGEVLALVGPSGSGKTTVLRSIAGLYKPLQARVTIGDTVWLDTTAGIDLPPYKRRVGVVFQNYALFPHMTALQNVLAAMQRPDRAKAAHLLNMVNLHGLSDRRPAQLSGGQQQRVAVARALAREPQALLLDEPFSAVDRTTREKLHAEIHALRAALSMPVILVTHDMHEAQHLGDRMAVMAAGRIVSEGTTAQVMADPDALRQMGLHDVAALLPAIVTAQGADGLTRLDSAGGPLFLADVTSAPGARLSVRILAHEVILARHYPHGLSAQNILAGHVARIVPGPGADVMVHVAIAETLIFAHVTARAMTRLGLEPGAPVHAIVKSMSVARDQGARGQR